MKALIVDTQELYRLSLKEVVSLSASFTEIVEAGSEKDFLAATSQDTVFDLILITPHQLGKEGSKWMHLAQRLYPKAALVALYNRDSPAAMGQAEVSSNANCEMLPRDSSVSRIMGCLRRILKINAGAFTPSDSRQPVPNIRGALEQARGGADRYNARTAADLSRLSFRQRQILAMASDGLPNKEIAARLDIAEGTVKAHMHAIFKVLGVTNRTQAVLHYSGSNTYKNSRQGHFESAFAPA